MTKIRKSEMSDADRKRVCQLLDEIGASPSSAGPDLLLAAYQAVLAADTVYVVSALLAYKQAEAHQPIANNAPPVKISFDDLVKQSGVDEDSFLNWIAWILSQRKKP